MTEWVLFLISMVTAFLTGVVVSVIYYRKGLRDGVKLWIEHACAVSDTIRFQQQVRQSNLVDGDILLRQLATPTEVIFHQEPPSSAGST